MGVAKANKFTKRDATNILKKSILSAKIFLNINNISNNDTTPY